MNVRIFWVRAMKCMYAQTRPRFILSSEGVLGGMEFEPMLTPREKSPLPKMSPEEDRTRDAVDSEPKHYQLSYTGPLSTANKEQNWPDQRASLRMDTRETQQQVTPEAGLTISSHTWRSNVPAAVSSPGHPDLSHPVSGILSCHAHSPGTAGCPCMMGYRCATLISHADEPPTLEHTVWHITVWCNSYLCGVTNNRVVWLITVWCYS